MSANRDAAALDFQLLVASLDVFPPKGDNLFLRNLRATFDVE